MKVVAWATLASIQDFMAANPPPASLKSLLQNESSLNDLQKNLAKYLSGPMAIQSKLPDLEA